jgi:hypothetical protein
LFETPTSIYEKEGGLKIAQANLADVASAINLHYKVL